MKKVPYVALAGGSAFKMAGDSRTWFKQSSQKAYTYAADENTKIFSDYIPPQEQVDLMELDDLIAPYGKVK